ncbi:MAG: TolC family outer membrane protein [Alphaproteobacteria bacterium]|nr:TolC family outer membrane protein [Alphaproteobacteria bacterium]
MIFAVLGLAVLPFWSAAAAEHAQKPAQETAKKSLNLSDVVALGLSSHPQVNALQSSRRATGEELAQARAKFLPSLDLRIDGGYERTENATTRADSGAAHEDMQRHLASVTMTQLLFDGFGSNYEVQRQKARISSASSRLQETTELVGFSIVEAYLDVLRQRKLLKIARDNVASHVTFFDQITDGYKAGRSTRADQEQARARLAQARASEASQRQALREAEAAYRQQVGDAPGDLNMPEKSNDLLAADVEAQIQHALEKSPTMKIYQADIESAYAEARATEASFYPSVDLQLNASQGNNLGGIDGQDKGASALMVLNWNLYRGGADAARSREFNYRHAQSKDERNRAARELEADIRRTWAGMMAARERTEEFEIQAKANKQIVGAYKDQFDLSRRSLLDVLDAQNELFVARSNVINAEFVALFGFYRLLALSGDLLPMLGVSYPSETLVDSGDLWDDEDRAAAR